MNVCSIVGCEKPIMSNSKVECCLEHEEIVLEDHRLDQEQYEKERYEDYIAMIREGIR